MFPFATLECCDGLTLGSTVVAIMARDIGHELLPISKTAAATSSRSRHGAKTTYPARGWEYDYVCSKMTHSLCLLHHALHRSTCGEPMHWYIMPSPVTLEHARHGIAWTRRVVAIALLQSVHMFTAHRIFSLIST